MKKTVYSKVEKIARKKLKANMTDKEVRLVFDFFMAMCEYGYEHDWKFIIGDGMKYACNKLFANTENVKIVNDYYKDLHLPTIIDRKFMFRIDLTGFFADNWNKLARV